MFPDPRVTDDHIVSLGFGEMGAGFGVFSEALTKQAYTPDRCSNNPSYYPTKTRQWKD